MKRLLAAAALVALGAVGAHAQSYPNRPVTILVPLAPGGSTDTIGRIMAEGMRPHLGTVIVENAPGAGGTTGVIRAARSAPDGYLVQIGQWGTNVASGAVYGLPIDLLTDLQPVALIATQPSMIVGRKDLPANNLKELIASHQSQSRQGYGRQRRHRQPGPRLQHIFPEHDRRPDPARSVPQRGPGLAGPVGGQHRHDDGHGVDVRRARARRAAKAFAMTADKRRRWCRTCRPPTRRGCPDSDFISGTRSGCRRARRRTSIAKLNDATMKALADPTTRKRLVDTGQELLPASMSSPEAWRKYQKAEIEKWWPIIKAAGIKAGQ